MLEGMTTTLETFRLESAKLREGRKRGAAPYPPEMRRFAVRHAEALLTLGSTLYSAAEELGISDMTLRKWVDAAKLQKATDEATFVPVRVVEDPDARTKRMPTANELRLECPGGYVVRGLDLDGAAKLLRALS
jgi:transposase-like protein